VYSVRTRGEMQVANCLIFCSVSLLSWNCRRLGNPKTVWDLCRLLKENRPDMVFLMETKLTFARFNSLKTNLGFNCVFMVDSKGRRGGLALLWKDDFRVMIQNFSLRHINTTMFSDDHDFSWKFTGFYKYPEVGKRKESWALFRHLAFFSPDAWLYTSDFNEVLVVSEKQGGARRPRPQMTDFQNALDHCHLSDMGFFGPRFTWSNRRNDSMLLKSDSTKLWQTSYLPHGFVNFWWRS